MDFRLNHMNRPIVTLSICLAVGAVAIPNRICSGAEDLDQYGGLKSVQLEATGFFRVEKGDRWWFVTPEGNAFLSFGLNHTNPDYLSQSYNLDHWKKQFGADEASDPTFQKGFVDKVMKDLEKFGMNTLGSHSPKDKFGKLEVPYVQSLFFARTAYWLIRSPRDFPDVFSPEYFDLCVHIKILLVEPREHHILHMRLDRVDIARPDDPVQVQGMQEAPIDAPGSRPERELSAVSEDTLRTP